MPSLYELASTHSVLLVAIAALCARLGAPLPSAPVLVIIGALANKPEVSVAAAFAASIAGSTAGDAAWFVAGRVYGYTVLRLLCRLSLTPSVCVSQNHSFFLKWGGGSLIAAKFLPGVSVVAPPMAGAIGMSMARFLMFEAVGGAAYAGLFLTLGYLVRDRVQSFLAMLSSLGQVAFVGLLVALIAYATVRYCRRRIAAQMANVPRISIDELVALQASASPPILIDARESVVRTFDNQAIPGAVQVTLKTLRKVCPPLSSDRQIVVYCTCMDEATSALACRSIKRHGHSSVRALKGGLASWIAAGLPVEREAPSVRAA